MPSSDFSLPAPRNIEPINCFLQGHDDREMLELAKARQEAESDEDAKQNSAAEGCRPRKRFKKIFVFCDGTGNEFAANANSNVVKLYTTLRVTNEQVAYYHPGVGTMGDPGARNVVSRFWSMVKGLAFAAGFKANVMDAYRYIMEVYDDGDEIYLFGFSRGAYTARAVAGMLHGYGLLCRGNEGHLPYAYKMFVKALKKQRRKLKQTPADEEGRPTQDYAVEHDATFAETFSREVKIRFVGVFDTVSSVGWIYKSLRLLDMAQNPLIQVGRHAVSIDERRANYRDNLWGPPLENQDLAQVWFPGVHSDVGGSYPQSEAGPANVALRWMIDELKAQRAQLCEDRIRMVLGEHSEPYAAKKIYLKPQPESHCLHKSLRRFWWLLNLFPQQHYAKDDDKIVWRVPINTPRTLPMDAIVHKSAIERRDNPLSDEAWYKPSNLDPKWLIKIEQQPDFTHANVIGCYVYHPENRHKETFLQKTGRRAGVFLGWLYFILFWFLLLSAFWFLLCGLGYVCPKVAFWVTHGLAFVWRAVWHVVRAIITCSRG